MNKALTIAQAKKLKQGDRVYWTDPDDGICSRLLVIQEVNVTTGVVKITDTLGGYIECWPRELSFRS